MTNIDKAADLLYQRSKELLGVDSDAAHRACKEHAQALADAGLLATDLPEENDLDIFASEGKEWIQVCSDVPHVWAAPDGLVMVQRIGPGELTPTEAREVAYALLAAAQYAKDTHHA